MELKTGYKNTELGVIPQDWDVVPMGQVGECLIGLTYSPLDVRDFGTLVLRSSNVQNGRLAFYDNVFVNMEIPARAITRKNDILICVRNGSRQLIGKCALIDDQTAGSAFGAFMSVLRSDSARFLFFQFQSNTQKRQIEEVMGATINQITNKDMAAFKVIWPPTKAEQEAIAEALSDTDALIESLEQLIAKKRHLKQGAMQELFCSKAGEEVRLLRDVSTLKGRIGWQGLKQTEFTSNDDEPFLITGMNFKDGAIRWNEVYHISEPRYEMAKDIQLKTGDVLMTKDGTIGKVLYIDRIPYPGKASLNSHLLLFRPIKESYNPRYLYYQLSSKRFKDFIELSKSGTTFFGISQAAVGTYPVLLPPIEDQIRIAKTLSDMDAEIDGLETKLSKTRQLKQGMMHNLLTGRIRLI